MPLTRRHFLGQAASAALLASARAQTGAPAGQPGAYAKPKPMIPGPYQPTWESLRDLYRVPTWLNEAKFGIFIHWGLYSIPAHINEWYIKHMYTTDSAWHTQHYGPPDKFGYKDFIPLFKVPNYRPNEWASLFKNSGARYVIPVAEHHDGFAMWDSDLTPWSAGKMGPKRDLIGELAKAVRDQNLIFGLSNHRMEHHDFAYPAPGVPNDQFDPRYAGFYGPPIQGDMNQGNASQAFQEDWLARVQEQIDKYHPQMIYFDNGVNPRDYDDVKLRAAAYYYNRAHEWGQQATLATKDVAYLFGSVQDFEKQQRAPRWIYPAAGWQVDDSIGSTWGYTDGMSIRPAESIIRELVEIASQGGNLLLNISPMGDGSIPEAQQQALLGVGNWLQTHGEAIYGSRPWVHMGEGPTIPTEVPGDWKGGSTAVPGPPLKRPTPIPVTEADLRFTINKGCLYAFGYKWPTTNKAILTLLATGKAKVERVTLLGSATPIPFHQTPEALNVTLPNQTTPGMYALKIEGTFLLGLA
ncbi:alpha-L-fucosidase [Granulicella tundricola]|uniref:alpha-L-fucosidase n=1 Tax=Granulicella tundricola (strain ATCC BAA-1859 / DSM 23138 / MP5ACTX9) TaxID=1198114 RepID=E8WZ82_GRATM|nr:alpha-L-fucosidase [Granulicella tundricola]ADW67684.1 Alpha-L-fucosidase [Granulicella tundricola MP5ACTX9]